MSKRWIQGIFVALGIVMIISAIWTISIWQRRGKGIATIIGMPIWALFMFGMAYKYDNIFVEEESDAKVQRV